MMESEACQALIDYTRGMKRLFRTCLIIVLLPAIAGCATSFTSMEEPEIHVINIVPLEADGLFEQRARVNLRIINPNDVDLSITGFSFHMDINDAPFTRGVSNESLTVPRLGEAKASVIVTTTVVDLARQMMAFEGHDNPNYTIEGKVYLANSRMRSVSFSYSGELTGSR